MLQNQGVLEQVYNIRCHLSVYLIVFVAITMFYKFALHGISLVLAFSIRKVKIPVLNDSQENRSIIYATTGLLLVLCLIIVVLRPAFGALSLIWYTIIFMFICISLGMTFVTKVALKYFIN